MGVLVWSDSVAAILLGLVQYAGNAAGGRRGNRRLASSCRNASIPAGPVG